MLRASIASLVFLALIGPALAFELVVVNEANFSIIHKLYVAPTKSKKWTDDKLQNQIVARAAPRPDGATFKPERRHHDVLRP